MNLRKSILALSVVAGIVAAPMTVFAAHTHRYDVVSVIRTRVETNKRRKGVYEITNR